MGRKNAAGGVDEEAPPLPPGAPPPAPPASCQAAAAPQPGGMDPAAAMTAAGMMNPMMAMNPMMNPMMAMMNPMMMGNPMMAMMMGGMCAAMGGGMPGVMPGGVPGMPGGVPGMAAGMPGMAAGMPGMAAGMPGMPGAAASGAAQAAAAPPDDGPPVDPQIRALCKQFNIEDRLMRKLNTVMMRRPESFDEDVQTLRERLGEPRADVGVLITQLDKGLFVSLGCMPKPMVELVRKYNLDDRASQRLAESLMKRKETMLDDLKDLDVRLASADRPSGLLMTLLQGLDTSGRLPAPPRSLGLPSGYKDRERPVGGHEPADRRDRGRSRSRSRSRGRRR